MRRKTLVNNLMKGYNISRETCEEILSLASLDEKVRGEMLSSENYVKLSHILLEKGIV
jgi:16S rRNA A1518/A1519 N6-dimethyltransferase RsmA/KsgA/DIM1 with predicted DNA glycosylase/AP lyase activity